jgi:hypothetical protein
MIRLLLCLYLLLPLTALAQPRRPKPISFRGPVEIAVSAGLQYAKAEIGSNRIYTGTDGSWQPVSCIRLLKKKPNEWQAGLQFAAGHTRTPLTPANPSYYSNPLSGNIPVLQPVSYNATVLSAGICMQRYFNMHIMEGFAGFNVGYARLFTNDVEVARAYRQEHNGFTTGIYTGFSKNITEKICITAEGNLGYTVFGAERLISLSNSIWNSNRSQMFIFSAPVTAGLRYKFN